MVTTFTSVLALRKKDVGSTKAEVAAQFVMNRVQGVTINHTVGLIQDQPLEWYKDFQIIICGLDNVEARRWINDLVNTHTTLFSKLVPSLTLKNIITRRSHSLIVNVD